MNEMDISQESTIDPSPEFAASTEGFQALGHGDTSHALVSIVVGAGGSGMATNR
jgi:hypothetical protein